MTATLDDHDQYLAHFRQLEASLAAGEPPAVQRLRHAAIDRFAALGFPTLDDEDWRATPLAVLTRTAFDGAAPRLSASWEAPALPPGAIVCRLDEALRQHRELVETHLARHAEFEDAAFVALNTACWREGVFIYLPAEAVVEQPIVLRWTAPAGERPLVWHPRCLIVAERHSQATIVERYAGPAGGVYFTNAVAEIVLGDGAIVDHCKVQQESTAAFHISTTQIQLARSSRFTTHGITLGGRLTRNDINAVLGAAGCECTLNGLYLGAGEQLIDNHTRIEHAQPHCASHELYKGILDGRAHGVFNGKIHVHPDAQKTDAKQTNQTLLLSADATIHTKPQLEIYADDVKCTHGATVGQLDAEALFYLRSRGLGAEQAQGLLTFAFANDIVGRIPVASLRQELEQVLTSL
jgi:Fe-S cluster assembly protein SufD